MNDSEAMPIKLNIGDLYSAHLANKKEKSPQKRKNNKKKRKKYAYFIDDDCPDILDYPSYPLLDQSSERDEDNVPEQMLLDIGRNSGFVFGMKRKYGLDKYVGMLQGAEGNTLVIGGNGSGKSASIGKPTLRAWQGAMCVTDIKGELSAYYSELFEQGLVTRPFIVFDPMQPDGIGYDPFYWLLQDDDTNLVSNIWQIALAIIPTPHNDNQPFWVETEQAILAAALLYYFQLEKGMGFSQAIVSIMISTVSKMTNEILDSTNERAKMFLGELANEKPEVLANFDRGLRNKLMLFATDPYISNAFRGTHEGATCFSWDDLDEYNVFLRIPANRIEQWSGAINLMYTQLIRHLERRPHKHSPEGANNIQTLLMMDEFARFGKLNMITEAMSTLRSQNVNFCLMIQSIAQLDKIYGEYDRRIIFDNCQYQAILRANDADTQKYLSELIGTVKTAQRSMSESLNEIMENTGYSRQISESCEAMIFPHELSTLQDVLLLTPYGFCRVEKIQFHNNAPDYGPLSTQKIIPATAEVTEPSTEQEILHHENELEAPANKPEDIKTISCRAMTLEEAERFYGKDD